ncbi:cell adhesion molecule Dscam1-like isoform X2 [Brevipalpus obovatus]
MRARLVCTVIQGDPPFAFRWFKDDQVIDSPVNSVITRTDDFSSDLTFNRVSPRHNGNYTCVVSNSYASDSHSAHLNVDVAPFWKLEPVDTSIVSGQNVLINCLSEGSPSPSITWERGSAQTPRSFTSISSGPHFEVYANGSLLIKSVEPEDGGLYLCQASNSIGPGLSKVITLTVHRKSMEALFWRNVHLFLSPPIFMTKFMSENVRLSDDIELECDARGDSPMEIEWFLDKQPIDMKDRFVIRNETWPNRMLSTLRIESARRRDSALFTCLVTNAYGKDETNIRLIVQEPPESPKNFKVLHYRSREAKLSWSQSFNGNSDINRFWITCHPKDYSSPEFSSFGHLNVSVDRLTKNTGKMSPEEGQSHVVRDLRPSTAYVCSVKAENDVGLSKASNTVEFKTEEQVPEGPPLNLKGESMDSRSVKVTWNPPDRKLWNGILKGYYIGYRISGSDEQYLYKTLEIGDDQASKYEHQVILSSLKPFTSYDIIIQVYNSIGAGPRSDPISATTLEDVPSKEPGSVSCSTLSSRSISITWEPPPPSTINGLLRGYKVIYRPLGGDILRMRKESTSATEHILKDLVQFTNYSIEVVPFTRKGEGTGSKPIYCRTADDIPGSPAAIKLMIASSDSAIVTWKDPVDRNGIITKYAVYWRELNNNRTRSSVTVPKSRANMLSSRNRWTEPAPQYKITSLRNSIAYEVWVSAFTRKGEGSSTRPVTIIPIDNAPAKILEWNETFIINGVEVLPFMLGCHTVGSEPIQRTWSRDQVENLNIQADGSLLIKEIPEESSNFTCQVSNEFGSDQVTYYLDRVLGNDKNLKVQIISTSHTSAQILFSRDYLSDKPTSFRDYEVSYRVVDWGVHDWQIKPIYHVSEGNNTVLIDNLLCGTMYKLHITDLQTGSKSDTITFKTLGDDLRAPKREDIIKVISNTTIHIYPNTWDQSYGCPITKMIIEYRSTSHHTWKMVSTPNFPHEDEPIPIKNLVPKTKYSIRITAYTREGVQPSKTAEYDVQPGSEDSEMYGLTAGFQRNLVLDTTTIISILVSMIVMISGCFIVVCMIVYNRHRNNMARKPRSGHYRRQSSISCAPSSTDGLDEKRSGGGGMRTDTTNSDLKKNQSLSSTQSSNDKASIIKKAPSLKALRAKAKALEAKNPPIPAFVSQSSPIKSRLPAVRIPTKQLADIEKDDYDEITPYATFRLTVDDKRTAEEEFKTFSVRIDEPGYMYKSIGDSGVPANSRDYKPPEIYGKGRVSVAGGPNDTYLFGVMNAQSVTSGSSNQEELLYAYEHGRRYQLLQPPMQAYYDDDENEYGKSQASGMDTPTDLGIRQFTKSPPRPNEQRQAACLTPGAIGGHHDSSENSETSSSASASDSYSSSADSSCVTPVNMGRAQIPLKEGRKASFTLLTTGSDKSDSLQASGSDIRSPFRKGLSSDDEDQMNPSRGGAAVRGKVMQNDASTSSRYRGRHRPRNRNKGLPYRAKSRSDEIEC